MKRFFNKKSMIITSVALLLSVTVGITLAYVFTNTEPVENTFKPSKVACAVVENGVEDENTDDIVKTATKTDVKIKNTGDTDAYIRVAVVVNWMSADGSKVWAQKPVEGIDYSVDWAFDDEVAPTAWDDGSDGYYYFEKPVAPGGLTDRLINLAEVKKPAPRTDYYLSIEIVASAIQSNGMGANSAQEAWAKAQQNG